MTWNQDGHRVIYTLQDEDLMLEVLRKLRPKFENTMRWYNKMVNPATKKKKQAPIDNYLKKHF